MDVLGITEDVHSRYKRYLRTSFYFRDPELRASFEAALDAGNLAKGPYLEATPVFEPGERPATLLADLGVQQLERGFLDALHRDRPLYRHQEEAIRAVAGQLNVVVATGTASGKTEAFLYPILLHLYNEFQAGNLGPGVRALILYPMNALSNDQRERLGKICVRLQRSGARFQFTFGQYVGETPDDVDDTRRDARQHLQDRLPGELVLRSEMRAIPPHILLTNYSMLEYLLLRPKDSPLFDNGRARWWRFLVLDEAHQYRGSRGIEMAMLLRRLKQRLREGGQEGPFRCIATSATLAGGPSDRPAIASFASSLFGEPFAPEAIILPDTRPVPVGGEEKIHPEDYSRLRNQTQALESVIDARQAEPDQEATAIRNDEAMSLGSVLCRDRRASQLRREVMGRCRQVGELADSLFPDLPGMERVSTLSDLVDLLVQSKDPDSGAPLLSARYHFFLRSLEGAFVSYSPEKRVWLERRGEDPGQIAFEVALCRECGQHYFVGRIQEGRLVEAVRDPSDADFGATFFRPLEGDAESPEDDVESPTETQRYMLCTVCGAIGTASERLGSLPCGHQASVLVERQRSAAEREEQIPRCSACGYRASDPVREVIHGADAPHSVIATTLFQDLSPSRRKVLAFADSRQEAAYFAWYLGDTYRNVMNRNLILMALRMLAQHGLQGYTLPELVQALGGLYRARRLLGVTAGDVEILRESWLRVYRELLAEETRISLEGVGLLQWSMLWPEDFGIPQILTDPPWSLSQEETHTLIFLLLDTLRKDKAVELQLPDGVSVPWNELELQGGQQNAGIGLPRGQQGFRSWDGAAGKRAKYLVRLLETRGVQHSETQDLAIRTLREIWQTIVDRDARHSPEDRLLVSVEGGRRLNPLWWRASPIRESDALHQCDTCGRLAPASVLGRCLRPSCPGQVKPQTPSALADNHYRVLYQGELPGILRVEEHTAQLSYEKAREYQRSFRQGEINVLSCSTTFELGVDLGDLDVVFLRNVPPEAFNYVQRVGRAGRRAGQPGLAITYCRRRPHDLYYFIEPENIINGIVRPPTLALRNPRIVGRHVTATVLSWFFRSNPERFSNTESLCNVLEAPSASRDVERYAIEHQGELEVSLANIVPEELRDELGLGMGGWIQDVSGPGSRLALAEIEVSSDYRAVSTLQQDSANRGDYSTAQWARARANTIAREDALSLLSRKAVIPKYGFPVDVVELDVQRTQNNVDSTAVSLQRDLSVAIAEYAPTCKLVANKKEWTSCALKRVPEREWPKKTYWRCSQHNKFECWEGEDPSREKCCDRALQGRYVVPQFGFLAGRQKPKSPTGRPSRVFTTRPYFAGLRGGSPDKLNFGALNIAKASPGTMVLLCEGRRGAGFFICSTCGAGFSGRSTPKHTTPYGTPCSGRLERLSLGHEFTTDVVQIQFMLPSSAAILNPLWFSYGLAYALLYAASEVLEAPPGDLDATVVSLQDDAAVAPIIMYDNVPGGAGLVARLEDGVVLRECLRVALQRVGGKCGCADETSCYGCLRTYRNQFAHPYLTRGPVNLYLEAVLEQLQET